MLTDKLELMLRAFIDESYQDKDPYLVGAYVVDRDQLDRINFGLDEIVRKTHDCQDDFPSEIEFHGQQMFQRSGEWRFLRERTNLAHAIYRRAVGKVASVGGKWFIAGVRRTDRLAGRYVNPWPPHAIALQYVLEMVDEYAEAQGEQVEVIADTVQNERVHEAHIRVFQDRGRTAGWKPRALAQVNREFQWVDSRDHRGLQAVDMLNYIYFRKRFAQNPHPKTVEQIQRLRNRAYPVLAGENIWTP